MPPVSLTPLRVLLEHLHAALALVGLKLSSALTVQFASAPAVTVTGTPTVTVGNTAVPTTITGTAVPFAAPGQAELNFHAGYVSRLQ